MVYLTRVEHFNAAHKLCREDWSTEENHRVFGKCANENWHGHNYEIHVTVKGEPSMETGFVFNAQTLSGLLKEVIIEQVDHKNLNIDVAFMRGKLTTAENFVIGIWNVLVPFVSEKGATLHCIRLYETPRIYVEYFGE